MVIGLGELLEIQFRETRKASPRIPEYDSVVDGLTILPLPSQFRHPLALELPQRLGRFLQPHPLGPCCQLDLFLAQLRPRWHHCFR
jgi:hypothetical protein